MPEICLEGRIPKHVFNTYLASINVYSLLIQKLLGIISPPPVRPECLLELPECLRFVSLK
ncbi:MAG: hypothetical protein LM600_07370 [Thaumarchaeota archaeon]|nr:hypothetical protein [Nitrososphaerota archaeon]